MVLFYYIITIGALVYSFYSGIYFGFAMLILYILISRTFIFKTFLPTLKQLQKLNGLKNVPDDYHKLWQGKIDSLVVLSDFFELIKKKNYRYIVVSIVYSALFFPIALNFNRKLRKDIRNLE